jgi:CDGSH-type Zn-finger protein
MSGQVKIADYKSAKIELEAGKTYSWCSCGHSKNQPFCDGSHRKTMPEGYKSLKFTAEKDGVRGLCLCKHTKNPPYCDGSHRSLPQPKTIDLSDEKKAHSANFVDVDVSSGTNLLSRMFPPKRKPGERTFWMVLNENQNNGIRRYLYTITALNVLCPLLTFYLCSNFLFADSSAEDNLTYSAAAALVVVVVFLLIFSWVAIKEPDDNKEEEEEEESKKNK